MKQKITNILQKVTWVMGLVLISSGRLMATAIPEAEKIENPIASDTFDAFLADILNIVVEIGTPIVIIAIIFVGFKFVMAQGNEGKLKEAKSAFFWVVIGAAIVIGCKVIVVIIQDTVEVISFAGYLMT